MRKLFDSISKSIPINPFSLVQNQYQYQYANKEENKIKIEIETDIFDLKSRMNSKPMFLARPWHKVFKPLKITILSKSNGTHITKP